ncbi:MAG TPA: bifunctional ornithine acetyltransferase/N-acetylglutamate synthase [Pseudogracilibacillus sp.]|nr:bifunctional ornithine acetyltransferase/N-acetylglutamate synthase [Pseudogracilibacillus sp.]
MNDNKLTEVIDGSIVTPKGFKTAGLHSGVKRKRKDLGVIYAERPANAAAVYTLNKVVAAPITVTKKTLTEEKKVQAVIVNSGNANACTGTKGLKDAQTMQQVTAEVFQTKPEYVAVASTGVIGEPLPMEKITSHIEKLEIGTTQTHAEAFSEAILTTDTFPKSICYETEIEGKRVSVAGCAKGSGMIEPNMGTMLAFITTDAVIESDVLEQLLRAVVNRTFNNVTVDGDTSTNDMVLVLASEAAGHGTLTQEHPDWGQFVLALEKTCEYLAKQIARDGEGATKLIEVEVTGATSEETARQVAKAIVGSSLVKTAVYGADANWGRIIAAVGYSGVEINPDTIDLTLGSIPLLKGSAPVTYSEEEATAYLKGDVININVDLHLGEGKAKAWGCDLTYDYVRINASYRT